MENDTSSTADRDALASDLMRELFEGRGIDWDRVCAYMEFRYEQDRASGRMRFTADGTLAVYSDEPKVGFVDAEIEDTFGDFGLALYEAFVALGGDASPRERDAWARERLELQPAGDRA